MTRKANQEVRTGRKDWKFSKDLIGGRRNEN